MPDTIVISADADDPIASLVVAELARFNLSDVGPADRRPLIVKFVDDQERARAAGLVGFTSWGWLFVEKLWVHADLRGEGRAERLLEAAEHEAVARGCTRAWLDTFNPHARTLYERLGYEVFGQLPDFVGDRSRFFMCKQLVAQS